MSLKVKIFSSIIAVLLLILGSIGFLNWHNIQKISVLLEASIEREGNSLVTATSEAVSLSLPSRDYGLVELYGKNLIQGRENIQLFVIFDEDGEVIFAYPEDNEVNKTMLEPSLISALKEEKSIISHVSGSNYEFIGALKSAESEEVTGEEYIFGFVKIWLYKAYIDQEVKQWVTDLFMLFAIIMTVSLVIFYLLFTKTILRPINRIVHFVKKVSEGDLSEISDSYDMTSDANRKDEIGVMTNAVMEMKNRIRDVLNETDGLIHAVQEGRLDSRGNTEAFRGGWSDLVVGVNNVIDAFITPFNLTAGYIARVSKGDIPDKIIEEYKGDFNEIKNNLNMLIDATNEVTNFAQKIAGGNLNVNVEKRSDQDELMQALEKMILYIQDVANIAETISAGDLYVDVTPKSDQDVLNQSLEKMIMYIQDVANVTEKISNKDLQVVVRPKSDQDVLNQSLQRMVVTLQTMREEIERSMAEVQQQNWFKTGQAELGNAMRGEQGFAALARNIISYLANYLQVQVGTIYLADGEDTLQLVGSYAYTNRKGNHNKFKLGDGLVGQVALEKQSILFANVPDDYITISSSLGETVPRSILVTPFMYEGEVKGVIELGTVGNFTEIQRYFLEQISENIAIAFHSTQTRTKMQKLLEATQQQAEELQAQQESLRVTNEELEAQTEALRESEKKLQIQQGELRQTNEELEEQAKALEQQQRTLQDKNLDLENAQHLVEKKAKELELSSKYKSEFLANMSHELRTPLNSLLILSKLLSENKDGNLTEKQVEFAQTIYSAGSDLLELINEVLDLSKIEAGKMVLNIEEMSLKGLSNYIEQHFAHMAEEKGLTLKITLAKSVPAAIHTDRQRVEQIVKNLLSNAIKFTSKGGITVDITRPANTVDLSRSGLNPQRAVAISVTDTGTGISEEKQDLIFEAFQQADGTTSRKYGGTGLGLSITRELTKLLGGEMQLRSKAGKGSTFTLYLPEKIEAEPQVAASLSEAVREVSGIHAFAEAETPPGVEAIWDDRHDTTSPADKLLLIVEDDPKFAKILFDLARTKEFKCLVAGDGAAGLQLAYQYKPSAIILDVGLPGMDGWAVMKKLKHNPETRHIPVHFISSQEASLDAMKMGAIGYLTKPVTLEMLDEVFKNIETAISRSVKKLLIVEDDDTMRKSMLELLGGEDVAITTTKTGQEAYRLLKSEIFDCMVLDLGLADISGFKLLEQIKADAATSYLPIIVYTGKDLTKKEETRLKKHAESIILKGVNSEERLLDEAMLFLHRVEADLPETQQKKLRLIHDKEKVLSGKTILMADDDMRNVFALSSVLEEKGLHVLIAENGKDALDLLTQHSETDLVLMDIMMPEMDGYEVMKRIRKQPKFRKLPIIALTAKAMKGDRQKCIDAGANDYLAKPVDTDKLLSLLRVWLY